MEMIVPATVRLHTKRIALIDADYIKYNVISAISNNKDSFADVPQGWNVIDYYTEKEVREIKEQIEASGYIFCFSGISYRTFRNSVSFHKEYKGNRKSVENQEAENIKNSVVQYIKGKEVSFLFPELEADDILCMAQNEHTFIYSQDKDLRQVPGIHYSIKENAFFEVTDEEALRFLMIQMITGDGVDNITGLKSYGIIKSDDLLTNLIGNKMILTVFNEYIKVHGSIKGIDAFVENWNLLKLREKRGDFFIKKYQTLFDTIEFYVLNNLNLNK